MLVSLAGLFAEPDRADMGLQPQGMFTKDSLQAFDRCFRILQFVVPHGDFVAPERIFRLPVLVIAMQV